MIKFSLRSADVYVHDVDRALDFYVGKLGFEKRVDEPMDDEGHRWVEIAPPGAETCVNLSYGFGSWSPEKVGGWARLIFDVDDMAAVTAAFRAAGVAFVTGPEEFPYGSYAEVADPDGNVVGLLQAAPDPS